MFEFVKKFFADTDQNVDFYQLLGKQEGLEKLVQGFYQVMETDPKAKDCLMVHQLDHGKVPDQVKQKLVFFLSGWLGGPPLFVERFGHPRMRARHMHVSITPEHAGQWLYCMEKSLDAHPKKLKKKRKQELMNSFQALCLRIINTQ